jgi:hypothetical protein
MGCDVLFLGRLQPDEPDAVAVNDVQGVPGLRDPEIEIGHLPGELVPVQRNESRQLVAH